MNANLYDYVKLARVLEPAIGRLDCLLVPLCHGWRDSHGEWVSTVPDLDRSIRRGIEEAEASLAAAKRQLR